MPLLKVTVAGRALVVGKGFDFEAGTTASAEGADAGGVSSVESAGRIGTLGCGVAELSGWPAPEAGTESVLAGAKLPTAAEPAVDDELPPTDAFRDGPELENPAEFDESPEGVVGVGGAGLVPHVARAAAAFFSMMMRRNVSGSGDWARITAVPHNETPTNVASKASREHTGFPVGYFIDPHRHQGSLPGSRIGTAYARENGRAAA